jgi:hypothetical protein
MVKRGIFVRQICCWKKLAYIFIGSKSDPDYDHPEPQGAKNIGYAYWDIILVCSWPDHSPDCFVDSPSREGVTLSQERGYLPR